MIDNDDIDESLLEKVKLKRKCRLALLKVYRLDQWMILELQLAFQNFIRTFLVFLHLGVND
jgi:hypothetical protein